MEAVKFQCDFIVPPLPLGWDAGRGAGGDGGLPRPHEKTPRVRGFSLLELERSPDLNDLVFEIFDTPVVTWLKTTDRRQPRVHAI